MTFHIRPTSEQDWLRLRDIRLEMLRDSPEAFAEKLEDALALPEEAWRARASTGIANDSTFVVAIDDDTQEWIGSAGGLMHNGTPYLYGVYVRPQFRGTELGVLNELVEEVEFWARTEGSVLALHVHADSSRAQAAYRRLGFRATGNTIGSDRDPGVLEIEMVKEL